eukprot:TRINITY_DN40588_c0_g1_i2.p1 TRINITY_DN40588_c0_g1~~TRINITY_DN40588_c0_g1_i2.p1  ORF type:complete len:1138 (+),score=209.57 TRINITY_DN40588_c0_g1_i2:71-3484(+)
MPTAGHSSLMASNPYSHGSRRDNRFVSRVRSRLYPSASLQHLPRASPAAPLLQAKVCKGKPRAAAFRRVCSAPNLKAEAPEAAPSPASAAQAVKDQSSRLKSPAPLHKAVRELRERVPETDDSTCVSDRTVEEVAFSPDALGHRGLEGDALEDTDLPDLEIVETVSSFYSNSGAPALDLDVTISSFRSGILGHAADPPAAAAARPWKAKRVEAHMRPGSDIEVERPSYTERQEPSPCQPQFVRRGKVLSLLSPARCLATAGDASSRAAQQQKVGYRQIGGAGQPPHPPAPPHEANLVAAGEAAADVERHGVWRSQGSQYDVVCARKGILPKFEERVRASLDGDEVDLTGLGMGDEQFCAILSDPLLLPVCKIRRWILRDTRIGAAGVADWLRNVPKHSRIEFLDLSENDLTKPCIDHLSAAMKEGQLGCLKHIDLSSNKLRSKTLSALFLGLKDCVLLQRLDLDNNVLVDTNQLSDLVASHQSLMRLSLRRNRLTGLSAAALFHGILANIKNGGQFADVDLAWNCLGSSGGLVAAEAIGDVFKATATLYHCDLSYNGLDVPSCRLIAEALRDNHSLFGLHMVGNAARMDADGFLVPKSESVAAPEPREERGAVLYGQPQPGPAGLVGESAQTAQQRQASVGSDGRNDGSADVRLDDTAAVKAARRSRRCRHKMQQQNTQERDMMEQQTACWACEGWQRVDLAWPLDERVQPKAVWAFTSLDGFQKGVRLKRFGRDDRLLAARMVPPAHEVLVVYQVDAELRVPPGCERRPLAVPAEIKLLASEEVPHPTPLTDDQVVRREVLPSGHINVTCRLDQAAVVKADAAAPSSTTLGPTGRREVVLDSPTSQAPVVMPRVTEPPFVAVIPRTPFYSGFEKESPELMKKCLKHDWAHCRFGSLLKNADVVGLQKLLESRYRQVIGIYRRLSAMDISGNTDFGVSQLQLAELSLRLGLAGDSITKVSDIDRLFITAKVTSNEQKKRMVIRNEKSLVRYEFLEFLLRLAVQRFLQPGVVSSLNEGLRLVLDALAVEGKQRVDELDNFLAVFQTEAVDDVVFKHDVALKDLYINETESSSFQEMNFKEFRHAVGAVVFLRSQFDPERMPVLLDSFIERHFVPVAEERRQAEKKIRGVANACKPVRR